MKLTKIILAVLIIIIACVVVGFLLFTSNSYKLKAQPVSALVQVVTVREKSFAKTIITYGTVSLSPEKIQQITLQNEVMVQQIFVTQGQKVQTGDPLLKLVTSSQSKLSLINAHIAVDYAKKQLSRLEKLRTQYLATNAEIQAAEQNLAKAEAQLDNLNKQLKNENGKTLQSTCNCNIVSVNVEPGQVVPPSTPLLTFVSSHQFQIRLGVEYEDLAKIRLKQKVIIKPVYKSSVSYTGYIQHMTDQINPKTGLIDVIVPLSNVSGLIPGTMVEGVIYTTPEKKYLAVPHSAVLYEKNKPYVFIVKNKKAEKHYIQIGEKTNDWIGVKSGIQLNDAVVSVGNYELKNGMDIRLESTR